MGFPLEFCVGAGVSQKLNDGAFRWWKKCSDRTCRFDTIPECDGHPASQPPSQVAVAITLNAQASSLKACEKRNDNSQYGWELITLTTAIACGGH